MPELGVPPAHAQPPSPDGERTYDSFVVRLWREAGSGRVLRAEVEHVQGGAVAAAAGVTPEWVLEAIRRCLDRRPPEDGAAEAPVD